MAFNKIIVVNIKRTSDPLNHVCIVLLHSLNTIRRTVNKVRTIHSVTMFMNRRGGIELLSDRSVVRDISRRRYADKSFPNLTPCGSRGRREERRPTVNETQCLENVNKTTTTVRIIVLVPLARCPLYTMTSATRSSFHGEPVALSYDSDITPN